jgi:segregation and condensation protein A
MSEMSLLASALSGYNIHLPVFEGPLDLLLHLIRQNEVDVYDIPIAQVTDQYLEYLALMEALDLEVAGEFLVMAATLLEIKSRMLLPPDPKADNSEEGVDPRTALVERLIEYARFKEAASMFREREAEWRHVFVRGAAEFDYSEAAPPVVLKDITAGDLLIALTRILADVGEGEEEVTSIQRRKLTVRMKMSEIWRRISNSGQGVLFEDLFIDEQTRSAIVTTFLALLELLRLQRVMVRQNKAFDRIEIFQYNQAEKQ